MTFKNMDDVTLLELITRGYVEALGELYDRYHRLVFSMALFMIEDRETAEEITQDTFTRVWEQASSYREKQAKVKTWLVSIARNRTIDELRRRRVRPVCVMLDELLHARYSLEETVDHRSQQAHLQAALAELPSEQSEVLIMSYFLGYSQAEISTALSLPLGTVKTRIRLGMQKLRHNLSDVLAAAQAQS